MDRSDVTSQINLFFIKVRTEGQEKIGNLLRPSKQKAIINLVMLPILIKLRQKFGTRDFIYSRDLTKNFCIAAELSTRVKYGNTVT